MVEGWGHRHKEYRRGWVRACLCAGMHAYACVCMRACVCGVMCECEWVLRTSTKKREAGAQGRGLPQASWPQVAGTRRGLPAASCPQLHACLHAPCLGPARSMRGKPSPPHPLLETTVHAACGVVHAACISIAWTTYAGVASPHPAMPRRLSCLPSAFSRLHTVVEHTVHVRVWPTPTLFTWPSSYMVIVQVWPNPTLPRRTG